MILAALFLMGGVMILITSIDNTAASSRGRVRDVALAFVLFVAALYVAAHPGLRP